MLGAVHVSTSAKEVRRGHQSPWSWSYGVGGVEEVGGMVSPLAWVLGSTLAPSGRAAQVLNW